MSSREFEQFDATVRKILSVSREELKRREDEWKRQRAEARNREGDGLSLRPFPPLQSIRIRKPRVGSHLARQFGEGDAFAHDIRDMARLNRSASLNGFFFVARLL